MHKQPEYTRIKLREVRKKKYGKNSFKRKGQLSRKERKALREEREKRLKKLYELFDKIAQM